MELGWATLRDDQELVGGVIYSRDSRRTKSCHFRGTETGVGSEYAFAIRLGSSSVAELS